MPTFFSSPWPFPDIFNSSKIFSRYEWRITLIANVYWVFIICLTPSPSHLLNNCSSQQPYGGWHYVYFHFTDGKTEADRSVCNIFHASLCLRITSDIIYSFLDYSSLILISTILKSLFNLLIDFFCFIILCIFKNSLFSFFQNSSFLTLLNFLLLETY